MKGLSLSVVCTLPGGSGCGLDPDEGAILLFSGQFSLFFSPSVVAAALHCTQLAQYGAECRVLVAR